MVMVGSWRCVAAGWTLVVTTLLAFHEAGAGGTTPNLREIFVGRCWEYQTVINADAFTSGPKNCASLYQDFLWAFDGRQPCNIQIARYDNYTQAAAHPIEPNKSMFWIGVYHLVHRYSEKGRRFVTISDTMTGYLVNALVWCSKQGGGMETEDCPGYASCNHETIVSFWRSTSIQYAQLARGTAYLMLNGSRGIAFTDNSVFAQYELPNIDVSKVHKIHAYIVHDIGKPPRESCNDTNTNSSITKLRRLVEARHLEFECTDDPISVRLLQCVDQPTHPECQSLSRTAGQVSQVGSRAVCTFLLLITILISIMVPSL